jgi:hypothetical protein
MVKKHLIPLGAAFMRYDFVVPKNGTHWVSFFPFYFTFNWSNFKEEEPVSLDLESLVFAFVKQKDDDVIRAEIPVIRHWKCSFDYKFQMWFVPIEGRAQLEFTNITAKVATEFKATDTGRLSPQLKFLDIEWGNSYITLPGDYKIKEFAVQTVFNAVKYCLQSAMDLFGTFVLNQHLPRFTDEYLLGMVHIFDLAVPQFSKKGNFNLDYVLTANPDIVPGHIDLAFWFDIGSENQRCTEAHAPLSQNYPFNEGIGNDYMQFIVQDRVVNCLLRAMEKQNWFRYKWSTLDIIRRFKSHSLKIDSEYVKRYLPQFAEKYGNEQELQIVVKMVEPRFYFGYKKEDADVRFDANLQIGIRLEHGKKFIWYDQLALEAVFDTSIINEVWFATIKRLELKSAPTKDDKKHWEPLVNKLGMTRDEYTVFLGIVTKRMDEWKEYLNEKVFKAGVPLPYWNLALKSKFKFYEHAVLIMADILY